MRSALPLRPAYKVRSQWGMRSLTLVSIRANPRGWNFRERQVRRPCRRLQRRTLAPSPKILCELLQHRENAPLLRQGRARLAPGSAHRTHRIACPGRRHASPIRSNLSFRYTQWQNAYVEHLIGAVRRECRDRMLVFGEAHLRRVLASYAAYYNQVRTHLALGKDVPLGRAVQRSGVIVAIPILSGLHHHYVRI